MAFIVARCEHGVCTDVQRVEDQYLDEDLIVDYSIIIFGCTKGRRPIFG